MTAIDIPGVPSEDLLERLRSDSVTDDDVYALLTVFGSNPLVNDQSYLYEFFDGSMLESYKQAVAWWPKSKDLPADMLCPTIYQLCFRYMDGPDFATRLMQRGEAVQAWLAQGKHNAAEPNTAETPAQRAKRLSAEAQRRFRARQGSGPEADHANAVTSAYKRYIEGCQQRKGAILQWDIHIAGLRAEWEALKNNPPAPEGTDGLEVEARG